MIFVLAVASAAVYEFAIGVANHFGKPHVEFKKDGLSVIKNDWPYFFEKSGYVYSLVKQADGSLLEIVSQHGFCRGKNVSAELSRPLGGQATVFVRRYENGPEYRFYKEDQLVKLVVKVAKDGPERLYEWPPGAPEIPAEYSDIFKGMDGVFDEIKLQLGAEKLSELLGSK